MKKLAILFVGFVLLVGCTKEGCQELTSVSMKISFKSKATQQAMTVKDSITVYGVYEDKAIDSLIYNKAVGLTKLELPLRFDADQAVSRYVIVYKNTSSQIAQDTLTVKHKNFANFISTECGCNVLSQIEAMSIEHAIGTVAQEVTITNPQTSTFNVENGVIFF